MPNNEVIIKAIIRRIQEERQKQQISQSELAKASGIKQAQISRLEAGKRSDPSLSTLLSLMGALGLSWQELLDENVVSKESIAKIMFHPAEINGPAVLDFEVKEIIEEDSVSLISGTEGSLAGILKIVEDQEHSPAELDKRDKCLQRIMLDFRGRFAFVQSIENKTLTTFIALDNPLGGTARSLMLQIKDCQDRFDKAGIKSEIIDKAEIQELLDSANQDKGEVTSCFTGQFSYSLNKGVFARILEIPGVTVNINVQLADQASVLRTIANRSLDIEEQLVKQQRKGYVINMSTKAELKRLRELQTAITTETTQVFQSTVVFFLKAPTLKELQEKETLFINEAGNKGRIMVKKLDTSNKNYKLPSQRVHTQFFSVMAPWVISEQTQGVDMPQQEVRTSRWPA